MLNKFFIKSIMLFCFLIAISCSKKLELISTKKPIKYYEELDTLVLQSDTTNLDSILNPIDTIFNDTINFALSKNGTVYFQCDIGPYNFTLDSLLLNGNFTGNLKDTAFHIQNGIQPNAIFGKHYDYEKFTLYNANNIDFTILRSYKNNSTFETIANFNYDTIYAVNYYFENDTLQQNELPFYNAVKFETTNYNLELYFFNKYIGGCLHDELVWYYYE